MRTFFGKKLENKISFYDRKCRKNFILKDCNNRSVPNKKDCNVPNSQWSVAQKNHYLKLININIRAKKIQQEIGKSRKEKMSFCEEKSGYSPL